MTTENKRPSHATRIAAVLVLGLMFIGLIAATEFSLRVVGLGKPLLYYSTVAPFRYALKHDQSTQRRRNAIVSIDQYGLRTMDEWGRPDAELRILFVGDSVTYGGSRINNSELFSSVTCDQLRQENNLDAICGNAGVNNYGTDNIAGRIRAYDGPAVDAIVVTVLSRDTLRGEVQLHGLPFFSKAPPGPVPAIMEAFAFVLEKLRKSIRFPRGSGRPHNQEKEDAFGAAVAAASLENLYEALREVASEGVRVLLVHTPSRHAVQQEYDERDEFVIGSMRASGFPFLEMRPVIREYLDEKIFVDSVHLDVAGHAIYGSAIAGELRAGF